VGGDTIKRTFARGGQGDERKKTSDSEPSRDGSKELMESWRDRSRRYSARGSRTSESASSSTSEKSKRINGKKQRKELTRMCAMRRGNVYFILEGEMRGQIKFHKGGGKWAKGKRPLKGKRGGANSW